MKRLVSDADKPLRLLHLEDDRDYVELVKAMLEKEGLRVETVHVDNHADFTSALEQGPFDLILGDYTLPTCTGLEALETARQKCPDTPFLLVSGTIGERAAIESLQSGATDYVLKQWPERLVPAVRRAAQTAHERAQLKRAEGEQRLLSSLLTASPDHIYFKDRESRFLRINQAHAEALGLRDPGEAVGKTDFDFFGREHAPQAFEDEQQVMASGQPLIGKEEKEDWPDGRVTWVSSTKMPLRDRTGKIIGLMGISRDITERKQAQERLRLQGAALEATANTIVITDRAGTVLWVNPAFTRLTGYSAQEILGQNPRLLKSGRQDQAFYQNLWDTILAGRVWQAELVNRRKDGSLYSEENTITPVRSEQGEITHFIAVKHDITARKGLETELRQAQKMEAIGQLAGGVAHDFNNLLTVIQGYASMLQQRGGVAEEDSQPAQQIVLASERAAGLTRQLLAFSRRQLMQPRLLNLNEVVGNLSKMLGRILGEDIRLELTYSPEPALVQADAGMLEQVLMNLAVNARDAMPKGGQLGVRVSVVDLDAAQVALHAERSPGRFVCLSVVDKGCGIPPENLARIFEPFFTTKEAGRGTGLGLATVDGIVKQHGGWVQVESAVGQGTTFRVYLPASGESALPAADPADQQPARGGRETILIVEDEVAVRELICQTLAESGYQILQAASGVRALEVWRQHKVRIDLLLTDLVMPDQMNGWELAKALWSERPELKVILTTGYGVEVAGKEFGLRNDVHLLQKPYSPQRLARAVRDCLDRPKPATAAEPVGGCGQRGGGRGWRRG